MANKSIFRDAMMLLAFIVVLVICVCVIAQPDRLPGPANAVPQAWLRNDTAEWYVDSVDMKLKNKVFKPIKEGSNP